MRLQAHSKRGTTRREREREEREREKLSEKGKWGSWERNCQEMLKVPFVFIK